jgi:hypothetical protein
VGRLVRRRWCIGTRRCWSRVSGASTGLIRNADVSWH